ncbi:MAG: hypothetical protein LH609_20385 [Rudanella sp.]|nr:hypothetical protein [Rudanella sp.]
MFKSLANAGKEAFGPKREPRPERLSKTGIDSVARQLVAARTGANAQTVQFDSTAALSETIIMAQGTASRPKPDTASFRFTEVLTLDKNEWKVAAEHLDK